ncbi:MAG: hypothetical protein ACI4OX_03375, partial [Akkermansia sp.]
LCSSLARLQSKFIIGSYSNLSKNKGTYYLGGMQLVPSQAYQSVSDPSKNSASPQKTSPTTTAAGSLIGSKSGGAPLQERLPARGVEQAQE